MVGPRCSMTVPPWLKASMPMYLQLAVHPPVTVTVKFQLHTKGLVVWASIKPAASSIAPRVAIARAIFANPGSIWPPGWKRSARSVHQGEKFPESLSDGPMTLLMLARSSSFNAARAQLAVTRSSLFPQVGANANFNGGEENTFQSKYNFLTLVGDAAFQLDLFGRLRRATEASRAELLATDAARQTVILTLVSDVANDYFTLRQLDLQLQITHETITTQTDSVKLTKLRLEHGVATKLDVLQAQQVLDTANADIPNLEREIGQEEDAINIIFGNYPNGVARGLALVDQEIPPEVHACLTAS